MEEYFTIILEAGERERKKEGGERMRERERERESCLYHYQLTIDHPTSLQASFHTSRTCQCNSFSISVALLGKLKVIIHCKVWSYFN